LVVAGSFMTTVQRALAADPRNSETQLNLSTANEIFADIHRRRGDDRQAIAYAQKALAIDESIVRADNKNFEVRGRLAPRHRLLADLYLKIGETEKAALHRQKAGA
jgi:tetratricopeptide (TPR) repeat protein